MCANEQSRMVVVWCPDWPVTAVGLDAATPAAVVSAGGTGKRVEACSAAARAAGVQRGQRIRDAQRHCPDLVVRERDVDAEGRMFEPVVAALMATTPWVEVVRPGMCAVPVRGLRGQSEESFRIELQDTVVELGFDCGVGIADGLFGAELAARAGDGGLVVPAGAVAAFLAPYPVAVLGRPELGELLPRLGIHTLGEFAALSTRHVTERFGAREVAAHRLARGLETRPTAPRRPRQELAVAAEFDPPAETADQVIFAAKTLAERLHEILNDEGLVCLRLGIEVTGADGRELTRLWRHGGELSALAVVERVRWQLASWETSAEPRSGGARGAGSTREIGGVVRLRLIPDQPVADVGNQQVLPGAGRRFPGETTDRIARAAARIQAMLGHQAVIRPLLGDGRGPGERVVRVPVGDLPPGSATDGPWPGRIPDPAPTVVHPAPLPVSVSDADGAPVTVSGRCVVSAPPAWLTTDDTGRRRVTEWTGPWPVREQWWDPRRSRRRARFQLITDDGRAHLLLVEAGDWHLEADYE